MDGGGAQLQVALIAKEQVQAGHRVDVGILARGVAFRRLENSGATIHIIKSRGAYDPLVVVAAMKLVSIVQPDVVHTWLTRMDVVGGIVTLLCRRPWILSERASAPYYSPLLKNWVRSRLASRANAIVSNSAAGDSYWKAAVGDRVRRHIVPNAVPIDDIDRASGTAWIPQVSGTLVLFAGRFAEQKNVFTLISALHAVMDRSDAVAMLCGEGPLKAAVELAIEQHALKDRVYVAGYQENLWSLMKRASVFVSVSLFEGHPNTVLEAMACRCPLVVSDIPEHREFLTAQHAWIVNPHEPARIAEAICEALTERAEAERRATAARARVEQYSVSVAGRRYDDVYRAVLSRGSLTPVAGS
jgi:glycosyltransferase involved in cell wall biosynthesis